MNEVNHELQRIVPVQVRNKEIYATASAVTQLMVHCPTNTHTDEQEIGTYVCGAMPLTVTLHSILGHSAAAENSNSWPSKYY